MESVIITWYTPFYSVLIGPNLCNPTKCREMTLNWWRYQTESRKTIPGSMLTRLPDCRGEEKTRDVSGLTVCEVYRENIRQVRWWGGFREMSVLPYFTLTPAGNQRLPAETTVLCVSSKHTAQPLSPFKCHHTCLHCVWEERNINLRSFQSLSRQKQPPAFPLHIQSGLLLTASYRNQNKLLHSFLTELSVPLFLLHPFPFIYPIRSANPT